MNEVAVIGLGYVGLPLACLCAEKGFEVQGIDLNKRVVKLANEGASHLKDPKLKEQLKKLKGRISASSSFSGISNAETIIVCVPLQ